MRILLTAALSFALTGIAASDALRCGGDLSGSILLVDRHSATCEWPFDSENAAIRCDAPMSVIARIDGTDYGLNGMATSRGAEQLMPVWLPNNLGGRVDVGPWIRSGLALCG